MYINPSFQSPNIPLFCVFLRFRAVFKDINTLYPGGIYVSKGEERIERGYRQGEAVGLIPREGLAKNSFNWDKTYSKLYINAL